MGHLGRKSIIWPDILWWGEGEKGILWESLGVAFEMGFKGKQGYFSYQIAYIQTDKASANANSHLITLYAQARVYIWAKT